MKYLIILIWILFLCVSSTLWVNLKYNPPYPRLGMWWLDAEKTSSDKIAKYDLILDDFEFDENWEKINQIRKINPNIKIFKPISPSEQRRFENEKNNIPNKLIQNLPTSFFLLKIWSSISENINEYQQKIQVDQIYDKNNELLFQTWWTLALGKYESAKILSIDTIKKTLYLQRWFIRKAYSHNKWEHIAMHITFWPKTWVMNVTDEWEKNNVIPWVKLPINRIIFYFTLLFVKNHPSISWENYNYIDQNNYKYDWIVIDRFQDYESVNSTYTQEDKPFMVDLYQNNSYITKEQFDSSWRNWIDILKKWLSIIFPNLTIIRNNALTTRYNYFDWQVYETNWWDNPTEQWWKDLFIQINTWEYIKSWPYLDRFKNANNPTVMVEVYEDESMPDFDLNYKNPFDEKWFVPNYKKMRFSLTSTLLGNWYYSYEQNTSSHWAWWLLWFDEYDNAGEGKWYLGYPTSDAIHLNNGLYIRNFEKWIVILNPQNKVINYTLPRKYNKIKWKQLPSINNWKEVDKILLDKFDWIILLNYLSW